MIFSAALLPAQEISDLLPDSIGEWTADGEPSVFKGEELFLYIDGGAEVYNEYGFVEVAVRDYRRGEDLIGVEVYLMSDSAYGIYSFNRSGSGEPVQFGDEGTLADYYLNFWSGPFMVVVTAQTEFADSKDAVLEVGRKLSTSFAPGGSRPRLMELLPQQGKTALSEVYFKGPIALQNISQHAARLFYGYEEGAAARYSLASAEEYALIVMRFGSPEDRAEATAGALGRLERTAEAKIESRDPIHAVLPEGTKLTVFGRGENIWLVIGPDSAAAEGILNNVLNR